MSNELEYTLNYREDGKKKQHTFKIDFVSMRCRKQYEEVINYAFEIQKKLNRVNELSEENSKLGIIKDREKIKDNKSKITFLLESIDRDDAIDKLLKRFEILKKILIDNQEDEKFLEYDFWDDCTEPSDIINFLNECYVKDNPKKKA